MMKEQLEQRLTQLKAEFSNGRKILGDLQRQEVNLRETLFRISGAIQVIEEELEKIIDSNGVGEVEHAN